MYSYRGPERIAAYTSSCHLKPTKPVRPERRMATRVGSHTRVRCKPNEYRRCLAPGYLRFPGDPSAHRGANSEWSERTAKTTARRCTHPTLPTPAPHSSVRCHAVLSRASGPISRTWAWSTRARTSAHGSSRSRRVSGTSCSGATSAMPWTSCASRSANAACDALAAWTICIASRRTHDRPPSAGRPVCMPSGPSTTSTSPSSCASSETPPSDSREHRTPTPTTCDPNTHNPRETSRLTCGAQIRSAPRDLQDVSTRCNRAPQPCTATVNQPIDVS